MSLIVILRRLDPLYDDRTEYDYEASVLVNEDVIWQGRVNGHNRRNGWQGLLEQLVQEARSSD